MSITHSFLTELRMPFDMVISAATRVRLNTLISRLHSEEHRGFLHLPVIMSSVPASGSTINVITPLSWQER